MKSRALGILNPFHVARDFNARNITQRWEEVNDFDEAVTAGSRGGCPGHALQQWYAHVDIVVGLFAPTSMLAQLPAMISPHNNDGVLVETCFSESIHKSPEAGIYEADRGVVAVS
jgi:hypothetical protein